MSSQKNWTAVECAGKHGGRMASVAGTEDIANILTATVNLRDKWIGSYKQGIIIIIKLTLNVYFYGSS